MWPPDTDWLVNKSCLFFKRSTLWRQIILVNNRHFESRKCLNGVEIDIPILWIFGERGSAFFCLEMSKHFDLCLFCTLHFIIKLFFVIQLYTNSLVNADSFYANIINTTFQKEPRYMYLMRIPSLTHTQSTYFSHYAKFALSKNIWSIYGQHGQLS